MIFSLVSSSCFTDDDLRKQKDFQNRRNLYNKYSDEELDNWLKIDLYEALDLDYYRDKNIPEDVLQYAVKWKSALYHPTKNHGKQSAFFIIKKAGSILGVPKFRKVYDSCFLDESLPEDREYESNEFFKTFSRVFERNGLFSEMKPVPDIRGDVETFYKFWQSFKTNRVYNNPEDVFEVNGFTKRQVNKDEIQQKKLKDLQRIQELVRLAIKRDPRIKKKSIDSAPWDENQLKSLTRFDALFGKTPNKFDVISKKLNELFLTKRTPGEIKSKIEETKKK